MNYTELLALIADFTEYDEADFLAARADFVRNAEERVFRTIELPCARKAATGSLTLNDDTLTHGLTDYFWPHYFTVTVAGRKVPLLHKEPDWIVEAYGGDTAAAGQPIYYAEKNSAEFLLGPVPGSAYAYEITYHGLPTSIVDGSTSWLGTNARNALLYGSLVEAAIFMRQDPDVVAAYETHFQEAMGQLADQGKYRMRKDNFRRRDKRPTEV